MLTIWLHQLRLRRRRYCACVLYCLSRHNVTCIHNLLWVHVIHSSFPRLTLRWGLSPDDKTCLPPAHKHSPTWKQHTPVLLHIWLVASGFGLFLFNACVNIVNTSQRWGSLAGGLASAFWVTIHRLRSALNSSTPDAPSCSSCEAPPMASSRLALPNNCHLPQSYNMHIQYICTSIWSQILSHRLRINCILFHFFAGQHKLTVHMLLVASFPAQKTGKAWSHSSHEWTSGGREVNTKMM